MALVFGDSFDHYLIADVTKKWTSQSGANTAIIAAEYAMPPHSVGLHLAGTAGYLEKTLPAALATFICGTWFRTPSLGAQMILGFIDAATEHVSVRYDAAGHITFTRAGTVLATSTNTIAINTSYHIECKVTISDTVGVYEVKVNGTSVNWIPEATGADTRNAGNATISGVRIYSNASATSHRYADFYILNTVGTQASNFLGPCRFSVLRPVGVGTTAEWTGNYADNWVNAAESDGDSTFNQSSTAGQTDQFAMTDVPSGTIHAIQHVIMARQDGGAQRVVRPVTRISTTDYNGTNFNTAATYLFQTEPVMFSPATGGATAFTDAEINGAEFGYEMVS